MLLFRLPNTPLKRHTVLVFAILTITLVIPVQEAQAQGIGVSATGGISSSVPAVISNGSQLILTGGFTTITKNFSTNGIIPQTTYNMGAPIGAQQSVTFFDQHPNANGFFTDTSSAFVNFLALSNGQLHGWVNAGASNLDANTVALTGGTAYSTLLWLDILVVNGNGLPAGTPVSVVVRNDLTGSFTASGNVQASLASYNSVGNARFSNVYTFGLPGIPNTPQGIINIGQTQNIQTVVGAMLAVEEQLNLEGSAISSGFADANASNTAFLNITSLTPGATLVSASGVDYSTVGSVPEPSSLLLLGTGLIGGIGAMRRRFPK